MGCVMDAERVVVDLTDAGAADRASVGGKARVLGELATAGFPVPAGVVVTAAALDDRRLAEQPWSRRPRRLGATRFAVRSSGAAEDLPDASYAGLYETYLERARRRPGRRGAAVFRRGRHRAGDGVSPAARRRRGGDGGAGAGDGRPGRRPGWRSPRIRSPATASRRWSPPWPGLGDPLVSGEAVGEEWTVTARHGARMTRPVPAGGAVLTAGQAQAVADLARQVADRYGRPQDIEWAHRP